MSERIIPNGLFFARVQDELIRDKVVRINVNGVSMFPLIRGGKDSVTIIPKSRVESIEPLHIVLFHYNGNYVMHRVVEVRNNGQHDFKYRIRGDGSYYAEEQCNDRDIVGVVTLIHKANGKVVNPYSSFCKLYAKLWSSLPAPLRRLSLRILKKIL